MNSAQTQIEAWSYKEEVERSALIANIFYGIGAGILLSGTIWFAVDLGKKRKEKKSKTNIAFTPHFTSPENFSLVLFFNY